MVCQSIQFIHVHFHICFHNSIYIFFSKNSSMDSKWIQNLVYIYEHLSSIRCHIKHKDPFFLICITFHCCYISFTLRRSQRIFNLVVAVDPAPGRNCWGGGVCFITHPSNTTQVPTALISSPKKNKILRSISVAKLLKYRSVRLSATLKGKHKFLDCYLR